MKRRISQGQAIRSVFGRARVTHFMRDPPHSITPYDRARVVSVPLAVALAVLALASTPIEAARPANKLPLRRVADVRLPGSPSRFDYQDIDTARRRLYVAHLGAGQVDVVDLESSNVVGVVPDVPAVHVSASPLTSPSYTPRRPGTTPWSRSTNRRSQLSLGCPREGSRTASHTTRATASSMSRTRTPGALRRSRRPQPGSRRPSRLPMRRATSCTTRPP